MKLVFLFDDNNTITILNHVYITVLYQLKYSKIMCVSTKYLNDIFFPSNFECKVSMGR